MNKNDTSDNIYIGGSKDFPIPRVGEFIEAGLATYPKVQDVVYDYEMNIIHIIVQATLKHMKFAYNSTFMQ